MSTPSSRSDLVNLTDEEQVTRVLVESVHGLWDVVNNLTRLKPSRRARYRVTHARGKTAAPSIDAAGKLPYFNRT